MGLEQRMLAWRKRMPRSVRAAYRLWRAATVPHVYCPPPPDEAFDGARLFASRKALVASLPKGGRVLEIGTDTGAFAKFILETAQPDRLEVIDIDYSRFDPALAADPRVVRHRGLSAAVAAGLGVRSFDWIYVDASHRYEDVLADARASARIVKPGGLILFNDFAHIDAHLGQYGVHRAVVEFVREAQWTVHAMAYDPNGLYDIAIRAPAAGGDNRANGGTADVPRR